MTREEFLNVALLQATEEGIGIHLAKFADICIKWGQQHPHWISVEDELPPIGGIVLVAIPLGGELSVLPLSIKNESDFECLSGMTHWMPLPQAPTEGIKGNQGKTSPNLSNSSNAGKDLKGGEK